TSQTSRRDLEAGGRGDPLAHEQLLRHLGGHRASRAFFPALRVHWRALRRRVCRLCSRRTLSAFARAFQRPDRRLFYRPSLAAGRWPSGPACWLQLMRNTKLRIAFLFLSNEIEKLVAATGVYSHGRTASHPVLSRPDGSEAHYALKPARTGGG